MKLSTISMLTVTALAFSTASSMTLAAQTPNNYKGDYKNEAPCPPPPALKSGFYLGGQAGYDSYRIRESMTGFGNFSVATSVTGWMGGLFGGYGQYYSDFYYFGGELLGNYNGGNQTILSLADADGDVVGQKFKAQGTFGISFMPGLKLNDATLGYLRLGYNWTRFQASDTAVSPALGAAFSGSKTSTKGGVDFGVGIETLVHKNWSLRTEYNHAWYSSFKLNAGPASQRFNPSDNQFTAGVLYHFA